MDSTIKWIGGGIAAALFGLGGAALATGAASEHSERASTVQRAVQPNPTSEPAAQVAAAETPFTIKRILPIDGPIKYGEWHWDDKNVPDGPIVITVDLEARVLSVFRNGYEIGAAAVLLGTDEFPTPLGTFPILSKQRHNVSEKYDSAPMPWSMFLTRDGVAIHGGSVVQNGYASHGCISAPDDFVSKVFAVASKGDKVVITRGVMSDVGDKII